MNSKIKKPLIGILANILTIEEGLFTGMERIYVNRDYVSSIMRAQGTPIILPIISDLEALHNQIDILDALVISGGYDVHPQSYSAEPAEWLEATCLERDLYELAAIRYAYQNRKPIFGICRGLQLLNVAFGGTLYQDINQEFSSKAFDHSQKSTKNEFSHPVSLVSGSWLYRIFDKETVQTNSFHHQAVKNLASGFAVTAIAEDGIIEAIEKTDGGFVFGVQWHPEMMTEKYKDQQKLFDAFVSQVQSAKGTS